MNSLDGRQRVREAITLVLQEDYKSATELIGEISQDPEMARGALIYAVHLVMALGMLSVKDESDFQKVLQHVFAVSAEGELDVIG